MKKSYKKRDAAIALSKIAPGAFPQTCNRDGMLLSAMINCIPDLVFYKDVNSVYHDCNAAFEAFSGKKKQDIIGHVDTDLFPEYEARLFMAMDAEMTQTKTFRKYEETVVCPDGREMVLETIKTPYYDANGDVIGLLGVSRDITLRKEEEKKVRYLSYHDEMTGLYNRTYFEKSKTELDTLEHLPLSIVIGDINGMKLINDAYGHEDGNILIKKTAEAFLRCCRSCDVVIRTGGDEFSVFLPNTDEYDADNLIKQIKVQMKSSVQKAWPVFADISFGYATKYKEGESFGKAMMRAEDQMYREKLLARRSQHGHVLAAVKALMLEKSYETEHHTERLAVLSKKLGEALGLTEDKMNELELTALLHDVGKMSVDQSILTKTEKLNEADWQQIKKHPEVGYRILSPFPELGHVAMFVLHHHEHWDGSGYPFGLSGEDIPLISRIIAVTDAYDAMTQNRAYRKALSFAAAKKEIQENAGVHFDPHVANIFVNTVLPRLQEEQLAARY